MVVVFLVNNASDCTVCGIIYMYLYAICRIQTMIAA